MKKFILSIIILFSFLYSLPSFAAGFQFNLMGGWDKLDTGGSGFMGRFQLSTEPGFFRFKSAFTIYNSSEVQQGEFSLGPMIYFLNALLKDSPAQPFVEAEGIFAAGAKSEKSRMDFGFAVGSGVDIKFDQKGGMTIAVQMRSTTEASFRIWLGWYFFRM